MLTNGYERIENAVPQEAIDRALRLLHLEIVNWGLPVEQVKEWHNNKTWFPTLRWHDDIVALAKYIPEEYRQGQMAEPQILLHFPDENLEYELHPHIDEEPPWAIEKGLKYSTICGVALSDNTERNGGFLAWTWYDDWHTEPVNLNAGDILVFDPKLNHSGSLNSSGQVRYIVYFRYLLADQEGS